VSAAQTIFKGMPKAPAGISVDPLRIVGKELKFLSKNIRQLLGSGHPALDKVAKYYTHSEGKHMRPLLVLLMSQATALDPRKHHTYSDKPATVDDSFTAQTILDDANPEMNPLVSKSVESKYDPHSLPPARRCHRQCGDTPRQQFREPGVRKQDGRAGG
jgi:hypothetical protein